LIDTKFLNEHATKFKTTLKKTKQIIDRGLTEFIKTPMYPDRAKYYLIIAYEELEKIACHLITNITKEKPKENCIKKLTEEKIFSERINRALEDLVNTKTKLLEKNFSYSEKQLYTTLKQITDELYEPFIKELAKIVKEIKQKEPKLAIPVNIIKTIQQIKTIKNTIKKIETFTKYPQEEFIKSPYAIDRTRYFSIVLIDSALWLCRHITRSAKIPPSKKCFQNLAQHKIISKETAEKLQKITDMRKKLIDPTQKIDTKKFYNTLKQDLPAFINFTKEIIKSVYGKKEK